MNRKIKEAVFCGNGQNICLRPMEEKDIPQVARLYRQIAVTEKNYTDKLSENSPSSFSKTGGMFLIQDEESPAVSAGNQYGSVGLRRRR